VRSRPADQRGIAAPLVVTLSGLLVVLVRATALQSGRDPCGTAASVASANRARIESCRVSGAEVTVRAVVASPQAPGLLRNVTRAVSIAAEARAGPVG
jgi:hypothetical protein